MDTPVLSKKQQKKTLSAKKRKKETIKNVVANTYATYWPEVSEQFNEVLTQKLGEYLPRIRNEKINVPWDKIKHIKEKEERREFRRGYTKQDAVTRDDNFAFGVNAVARLLEKHEAKAVLVDSDVKPRLLVQHILDLAVLHSVPVLAVGNLKQISKKCCGFASVTIGLKSESPLLDTITEIYASYPVPEGHVHYHRRLEYGKQQPIDLTLSSSDMSVECLEEEPVSLVHLKRDSKKTRAFVPEKSNVSAPIIALESTGFAPVNVATPLVAPKVNRNLSSYKSLVVKRLRGDKNRSQRINGDLKKRKHK